MKPNHIIERELLTAIRPIYWLSLILGVAPFTSDLQPSKKALAYTLMLMLLLSALWTVSPYGLAILFVSRSTLTNQWSIPKCCMILLNRAFTLTTYFVAVTASRMHYKDIVVKLTTADELIFGNHKLLMYKKMRRFMVIETAVFSVMCILISLTIIFEKTKGDTTLIIMSLRTFTFFVNANNFFVYCNLVLMMQIRYARINRILTSVLRPLLLPLKSYEHRIGEIPIRVVQALRRAHFLLHQISSKIDRIHGYPLLLRIGLHTVSLITHGNNVVVHFIHEEVKASIPLGESIVWLLIDISVLFVLAFSCHITLREAKGTALLVQECILENRMRQDLQKEYQGFENQVTNHKLVFTAAGVLNVDFTLLLNVAGLAVTYIIILRQ